MRMVCELRMEDRIVCTHKTVPVAIITCPLKSNQHIAGSMVAIQENLYCVHIIMTSHAKFPSESHLKGIIQ